MNKVNAFELVSNTSAHSGRYGDNLRTGDKQTADRTKAPIRKKERKRNYRSKVNPAILPSYGFVYTTRAGRSDVSLSSESGARGDTGATAARYQNDKINGGK